MVGLISRSQLKAALPKLVPTILDVWAHIFWITRWEFEPIIANFLSVLFFEWYINAKQAIIIFAFLCLRYRKDIEMAFLASCSLHNLLSACLLSENGPPLLDFEVFIKNILIFLLIYMRNRAFLGLFRFLLLLFLKLLTCHLGFICRVLSWAMLSTKADECLVKSCENCYLKYF